MLAVCRPLFRQSPGTSALLSCIQFHPGDISDTHKPCNQPQLLKAQQTSSVFQIFTVSSQSAQAMAVAGAPRDLPTAPCPVLLTLLMKILLKMLVTWNTAMNLMKMKIPIQTIFPPHSIFLNVLSTIITLIMTAFVLMILRVHACLKFSSVSNSCNLHIYFVCDSVKYRHMLIRSLFSDTVHSTLVHVK